MSEMCGNEAKCGFFQKYSSTDKPDPQNSIKSYCRGSRRGACEREVYRKTHSATPPDDMLPSGALIA